MSKPIEIDRLAKLATNAADVTADDALLQSEIFASTGDLKARRKAEKSIKQAEELIEISRSLIYSAASFDESNSS